MDDISKTYDLSKIHRTKDMVEILHDALTFINANRQSSEVTTASDLEYTAINGMLTQLDPPSIILPPKEFDEFKIGTTGKFGGLGMVVGLRDGVLAVISPIDGTPAARAGMKAGDKITEIDGESTVNMNLTESVGKLRGDPGTTFSRSTPAYPFGYSIAYESFTQQNPMPRYYCLEIRAHSNNPDSTHDDPTILRGGIIDHTHYSLSGFETKAYKCYRGGTVAQKIYGPYHFFSAYHARCLITKTYNRLMETATMHMSYPLYSAVDPAFRVLE